ncbi:hypothetical protein Enr17x_60090 [Gimesia fumaroli]|uniref:Uncharacterized protein n=1 Tax=Gimesia fumaroli TaxID=2527976 RepID=A0A518ILF8_9PLAN|nr:hypothetical protein Enr17x_60090 [Gimesia fumaroli]
MFRDLLLNVIRSGTINDDQSEVPKVGSEQNGAQTSGFYSANINRGENSCIVKLSFARARDVISAFS